MLILKYCEKKTIFYDWKAAQANRVYDLKVAQANRAKLLIACAFIVELKSFRRQSSASFRLFLPNSFGNRHVCLTWFYLDIWNTQVQITLYISCHYFCCAGPARLKVRARKVCHVGWFIVELWFTFSLRPKKSVVFYFKKSCLIIRLIQIFYINIIYFVMTYFIIRDNLITIYLFYNLHKIFK